MAGERRKRKPIERVALTPEQVKKAEGIVEDKLKDNPDVYDLPESKYNLDTLTKFFADSIKDSQLILPPEKRRYVMYLRKSTDSEDRQVRSLPDQRAECLILANNLNIKIRDEDIFEESASAKKSGASERPIFSKMLDGFRQGKYHGLIVWSPDRLSRNMKDAGEVIELIDLEKIQDLHFKTYQFENNPNGKMLLGILFATSKQYSDKLSTDVKRGTDGNANEGKYNGVVKKGYFVDMDRKYFVPDSHNWHLLRQAVLMRLRDNKTNQEVADFLNDSQFSQRKTQYDDYQRVTMSKQMVSDLFNDPFYCGIYQYGGNVANIVELYNFLPLVTAEEYIQLSRKMADNFDEEFKGRGTSAQRLGFGLLREKVICHFCDNKMTFQRTKIQRGKNQGRYMLSFYCRNKECLRHNEAEAVKQFGKKIGKSVRLKDITPHIAWTIQNCTKDSKRAYDYYIERLKNEVALKRETAKRKLLDADKEIKKQETLLAQYQNFQVTHPEDYKKYHKNKLEEHAHLLSVHTASAEKLRKELDELKRELPTRKQFVELVQSYLLILRKTRDLVEEDEVYKEMVLNLRVGDNTTTVIKLNPPYDLMVDLSKISSGRGERTRTFDLTVPNRAR